ncbi:hypothetical protein BGZ65_012250, partial [Modicella reniformis]
MAVGSTAALHLSSKVIYEILSGSAPGNFGVKYGLRRSRAAAGYAHLQGRPRRLLESAYEKRISRYKQGASGSSYTWATERKFWQDEQGVTCEQVEQAVDATRNFVKNKAQLIKAVKKSGLCDARALHRHQQELTGLRQDVNYWNALERVWKRHIDEHDDKATPPVVVKVDWHSHQVEEELGRIDIQK